jgi:hypothetical protein
MRERGYCLRWWWWRVTAEDGGSSSSPVSYDGSGIVKERESASFSRRCVSFLFSSLSTSASPCFFVLLLLSAGGSGSDWDCGRWLGNQVTAVVMVVLRRFFFSVLFFSSAPFFLLLPVLFLLPLSGRSYVSVVAAVVDGVVGGGGVVATAMRQTGGVCYSLFFFFPVQRRKPLFLCIFLPLTSLSLLLFVDNDGVVEGDWEERWRRWWQLCGPQPVVLPLLSSISLLVSAFFYSFTLFTSSKFPGSFLFFTPKIPPCSYLSLCPKLPLNLSFAYLLLQNFCPPGFLFSFSSPFFLSSSFSVFIAAGREGHLTTTIAQGKVATLPISWHRVGWPVMACINGGRVWDVACVFGQVRRAKQ